MKIGKRSATNCRNCSTYGDIMQQENMLILCLLETGEDLNIKMNVKEENALQQTAKPALTTET